MSAPAHRLPDGLSASSRRCVRTPSRDVAYRLRMRRFVITMAAAAVVAGAHPPMVSATTSAHAQVERISVEGAVLAATQVGKQGNRLTVTPTKGLSPTSQIVTVTGRGFSETVGIYVGLCVTPRPGAKPTPCGGGVNQDGSSGASAWISSNPPPYGQSLAIPYKRGGRFTVQLAVRSTIGSFDCRVVSCAIVARADHTRAFDRRWDVVVPVNFR